MWVPVAVWQPCELLYTCYLLTYLVAMDLCPSVRHKLVFYRNGWTNRASFWRVSLIPPSYTVLKRNPVISKNKGTSLWNFVLNSGLRGSWQDFNWHDASHGPSAIAELLVWQYRVPSVLWRCWLDGRKGIRPVKNWVVGCWRGYLSGARCRLAYGPADVTATHCLLLQ